MEWIIALFAIIIIIQFIGSTKSKKRSTIKKQENPEMECESKDTEILDLKNAYQSKWLFSYNEKDAFNKIKPLADKYGLTLLAKVRLLDLLEPQKGNPKYKTFFYKVQAKHVDFVLCDKKLVARCIIELDDNSHNTEKRQERDKFVDEVTKSVGYEILHLRAVNESQLETEIKRIFKIEEKGE